jgi:hypothetical protein
MVLARPSTGIAELRRLLERTQGHGCGCRATLPFGVSAVDSHLPGGGLALGHLLFGCHPSKARCLNVPCAASRRCIPQMGVTGLRTCRAQRGYSHARKRSRGFPSFPIIRRACSSGACAASRGKG